MGPNGSGKTTLFGAVTGDEPADESEVRWTRGWRLHLLHRATRGAGPGRHSEHVVHVFGLGFNALREKVHQFLALL